VLIYLDSYKLVRLRWVLFTIVLGGAAAAASYTANGVLLSRLAMDFTTYSRYVSPLVEESAKALVLIWFIRSRGSDFSLMLHFRIRRRTGFALLENATICDPSRIRTSSSGSSGAWGRRSCTEEPPLFSESSLSFSQSSNRKANLDFRARTTYGGSTPFLIHHLFFSPVFSMLVTLLVFPLLIFVVFEKSEQSLQNGWRSDSTPILNCWN